jgi:hypothetical protein
VEVDFDGSFIDIFLTAQSDDSDLFRDPLDDEDSFSFDFGVTVISETVDETNVVEIESLLFFVEVNVELDFDGINLDVDFNLEISLELDNESFGISLKDKDNSVNIVVDLGGVEFDGDLSVQLQFGNDSFDFQLDSNGVNLDLVLQPFVKSVLFNIEVKVE